MRLSLQHRLKLASALSVRVGALGGVCWALAAPLQAQTVVPAAPSGNATEASETDSAFWSRQERLEAAQIPSLQKRAQSAREMWNKASAPALARLRAQPVSAAAVGVTFPGQQTRSAAQWEVEAPRVALAFYGRWLTEEAQQLWPQGRAASRAPGAESYTWVQVCSIAGQLQARDVGEPRAALAIYDWALQSGADLVALSRLELERDQLIAAQRDPFTPAALPAAASVAVPQVGPMPPQASEKARSSWPAPLQPQASPAVARAPMITLSTGATSPIPATSPQTITLPKVATSPQMMTPATTAVGALGTPSPVLDAAFVRSSAALEQIRAGVLSPAAAWQRGDLRAEDAVAFLQSGRNLWIDHESESGRRLHHAFAEVLAQHASERLAPLSQVPPRVRLWLADYYGSRGDAHALEVAESLISEFQNPQGQKLTPGQMEMLYQVVQRLAWFYREQGQPEKAAQAWESLPELVGVPGWWKPDANWQAGRILWWAGDKAAAQELFDQAKSYNNSFFNGMMLYDQATFLLMDGKAEAAEKLLLAQLPAFTTPEDRVGPLWTLAQAQLQNQQFAQAKVSLTELTGYFQNPKNYKPNIGAEVIGTAADAKLQLLKKWENKAFDLPLTSVLARRDDEGVYHAKLYVHSLMPQDITVGFAPDFGAQLVKLEQLRSQRTDADVVVSLYDVAYQIVSHPNELKVRVSSKQAPSDQTQELRVRAPLPTE